jgi:hypothetical protein
VAAVSAASEVERRVVANAALKVVGRLDAAEAERSEYGFLTRVARLRATLLQPGTMIVAQPEIPTPILLRFPFPASRPYSTRSYLRFMACHAEALAGSYGFAVAPLLQKPHISDRARAFPGGIFGLGGSAFVGKSRLNRGFPCLLAASLKTRELEQRRVRLRDLQAHEPQIR